MQGAVRIFCGLRRCMVAHFPITHGCGAGFLRFSGMARTRRAPKTSQCNLIPLPPRRHFGVGVPALWWGRANKRTRAPQMRCRIWRSTRRANPGSCPLLPLGAANFAARQQGSTHSRTRAPNAVRNVAAHLPRKPRQLPVAALRHSQLCSLAAFVLWPTVPHRCHSAHWPPVSCSTWNKPLFFSIGFRRACGFLSGFSCGGPANYMSDARVFFK